jgi:hypothetical protein
MTRFLVTPENPGGWKLEDILTEIQNDMVRRCSKILEDRRPEARRVFNNNVEILGWLTQCIEKARDSTRALSSLGPSQSAQGGPPRIGEP